MAYATSYSAQGIPATQEDPALQNGDAAYLTILAYLTPDAAYLTYHSDPLLPGANVG